MGNNGRPHTNRFQMLNHFWDHTARQVTRTELALWVGMFRWARNSKKHPLMWVASISYSQLADELSANRQTIHRAVQSLREKGLLVRVANGQKTWKASKYLVYPDIKPERFAGGQQRDSLDGSEHGPIHRPDPAKTQTVRSHALDRPVPLVGGRE